MSHRIDGMTGGGRPIDGEGDAIKEAKDNAKEFRKMMEGEDNGQSDLQYYMQLQMAMMKEQQAYTALSNVLKARSDACLSAVRNFKQ